VVCPVRQLQTAALAGLPVEEVTAEFSGRFDWRPLLDGIEAVIHSAALIHIGWTKLAEAREVNVAGTQRLAEAAAGQDCRFIHISTVDTLAYSSDGRPVDERQLQPSKPDCTYVRTKREAEQVIEDCVKKGLNAVIVHPGFMLGPWDWKPSSGKMLLAIAKRQIPLAPRGGCSVADVRDVAAACLNALDRGQAGEHFILGGHNLSYLELFREMAQVVGQRPPTRSLPSGVAVVAGAAGDLWARLSGREGDLNSALIRMGQLQHYYDSSKAVGSLDYRIGPLQPMIADAWEFVGSRHLK